MSLDLSTRGPVFDGRLAEAIESSAEQVEQEIGDRAVDMIQARLGHVLKHPTGRYRRSIVNRNGLITDGGVVYGPWLEGVSRRNKRSRFKGYSTFRKIAQQLEGEAGDLAEMVIERELP